jgi:hypothetical protein
MKLNTHILLFFSAITLLFLSCEKEEIIFDGPYHVKFTDTLITVKESVSQPLKVSIHNAGPILDEDIKVKYSISGNARKGVDYSITGTEGEVEIPSGKSFGFINVNILNNANNILESQEIVFTILEVTPANLEIGRSANGIIGKSLSVVIEDDCILSGNYKAYPPDSINLPTIGGIQVTSEDCINYTLSNWDIYISSYFPSSKDLTFIDNGDNTLTIPEQEEQKFNEDFATMKGDGFIDPATRRITLNIQLVDFDDSPTFQIVFYPE